MMTSIHKFHKSLASVQVEALTFRWRCLFVECYHGFVWTSLPGQRLQLHSFASLLFCSVWGFLHRILSQDFFSVLAEARWCSGRISILFYMSWLADMLEWVSLIFKLFQVSLHKWKLHEFYWWKHNRLLIRTKFSKRFFFLLERVTAVYCCLPVEFWLS